MFSTNETLEIPQTKKVEDLEDENYALSLRLAHGSKSERRKHIIAGINNHEQLISATLEISRVWRGYQCRKFLAQKTKEETTEAVASVQSATVVEKPLSTSNKKKKEDHIPSIPSSTDAKDKRVFTRHAAAVVIQRAWRKHIDTQVFRYYRDLINFRGRGDPSMMLRCINPNEAKLLDSAAGIHVRFRLAGEKFPPNIYYKIYTHRPVIDMCANSPKDYTKAAAKRKSAKEIHNKYLPSGVRQEKEGWYERYENNGWRLVSDRLIHLSMDPITWETSRKTVKFHHVKLQRKADVEEKRRKRKIEWMRKMYKEGMLKARETDEDTKFLVEKAARGLVNTVDVQGSDAVMDWEVDELLQWTTALNFDDYLETWKECATSTISEVDVPGMNYSNQLHSQRANVNGALPVNFDPYALTRASSMGLQRPQGTEIPSASTRGELQAGSDVERSVEWNRNADSKRQALHQRN